MPTRTNYPGDSDVLAFLTSSGFSLPPSYDSAGLAQAAVDWWERKTGSRPFLNASSVVTTRAFDPPGPNVRVTYGYRMLGGNFIMELDQPLFSVSGITVGNAVGETGTPLIENVDYFLLPYNAPAEGRPWQIIRFRSPQYGPDASIQITGSWGYGVSIPEEVWQALIRKAAAVALEDAASGIAADAIEWKDIDQSEKYSIDAINAAIGNYAGHVNRVLMGYMPLEL